MTMTTTMTTKFKILAVIAVIAIGFGIYAIFGGAGNKPVAEINNQSTTDILSTLKPLARGKMAAMRILDKPQDLNNITFGDGNGKTFTVADWNGRTMLLNLWATWCPPCRHEMPALEDLEKQLGGENFEVVTVSIDMKSPDKPKAFFVEINLQELNFYWDGSTKIFNELKKQTLAFGMPSTILIDKNGMALGALNGPAVWNSPEAIALISEALRQAGN
jgi:thiol-disulfide isomerase/thioredoxin